MQALENRHTSIDDHISTRDRVARELMLFRFEERDCSYETDRGMVEYIENFQGLHHFFQFVKGISLSNKVLDIGAGSSRGINELSKSGYGAGICFEATGLTREASVDSHLGANRYRVTSAEILRGVKSASYAGVLALYSIAYSAAPCMTIDSIDRILVKGGVLKGLFRSKEYLGDCEKRFKPTRPFVDALLLKGYDVAGSSDGLIVAIKPGGEAHITAHYLLQEDKTDFINDCFI